MATNSKCTAFNENNAACPLRRNCALYANYLQHFTNAAIDEEIQKPKTIAVVFVKETCKNFTKK